MKIFLDTANLESIKRAKSTGLIDGITTNPTHLSKEGGDIKQLLLEICKVMEEDIVSIEVTETEPRKIYEQAKQIAALSTNVAVKIPCHMQYVPIIKQLVEEDVMVNVTLIFSLIQGLMMCKLGVYYISPFIGRLDDMDVDGLNLIEDLKTMITNYGYETEILSASLRNIRHLHEVALMGADIATIPVKLFETLLDNPLTDKGMALFDADWKKLGIRQFP